MRIAVWHNLPSGGGKRALYDHVRGLLAQGHHVEAWAPPTSDRTYLPLGDLIEEHIVPLAKDSYRISDKLQLTLHINRRLRAMDEHARRCAEQIAQGSFDVLFANSCKFFRAASIGRFVDLPSVLYLQEPFRWLYEAMPENYWAAPLSDGSQWEIAGLKSAFIDTRRVRNGRVQVREEIRSARAYGRILCNSYFSRESILRAYGMNAEVCYLGVDTSRFAMGPPEREPFIVALGSFNREKNPRLCIEAIGRMKGAKPKLVWIGNFAFPDYREEMSMLARSLGVELEVKVLVPDEDLVHCLRTASAMIYAPMLEPFGLAPIEAGACGTPVVGIAEGGVRETVFDGINGFLCDPAAPAIATALERLRDDPQFARKMGEEGRKLAETKWSQQAATLRLIAKLEAVISDPRS